MTKYTGKHFQYRLPSNEPRRRARIESTQRIPKDRSRMDESLKKQIRRSSSNTPSKRQLSEQTVHNYRRDRAIEEYLMKSSMPKSVSETPSRRSASSSGNHRRSQAQQSNRRPEVRNDRVPPSSRGPKNTTRKPKQSAPSGADSAIKNTRRSAGSTVNVNRNRSRRKRRKKRSKALVIILAIAALLLAFAVFVGINIVITKNHASSLKKDLEKILEYAKEKDVDGAEKALLSSYDDREKLSADLSGSFWTNASKIDRVKEELSAGNDLLEVVAMAQDDILTPFIELMKEQPLTELKVGEGGFNVTLINSYLDFVEDIQPKLEELIQSISEVNTDSMMGGYVAKYKDKLYEYTDSYNEASSLLPFLRTFLGHGDDRLYLFVAQNSAEIRASGGFPGSIGSIRIEDGVLTIGDFESVYDVLADTISYRAEVTDSEFNIFGSWINAPRDACFIPAFDRTAHIWATAYEDLQRENGAIDTYEYYKEQNTYYDEYEDEYIFSGMSEEEYKNYYGYEEVEYMEYVDGVVSLTPAIIQMLMGDIGEITLSDGTILDSENATKVLQHDLYHKYFSQDTITWTSNSDSDALFAETAKIVMSEFVSNFEISKFADYYSLLKLGMEKNIMQVWMVDEEEEEIMTAAGISGKLNFDPENPVTGIYFSLADPSKMGWYLDMIPEISEPEIGFDGSRIYNVKLTLRNVITEEDIENSHEYILGGYNGSIRGYVHCFAPAGGYIADIETSNWMYMFEANYHDLEVYYDLDVLIEPGEEIEITYQVVTAEGVDTPLKAITTPTLTEYR